MSTPLHAFHIHLKGADGLDQILRNARGTKALICRTTSVSFTSSKVPNFSVPSFSVTWTNELTSPDIEVVESFCAKVNSGNATKVAKRMQKIATSREMERFMIVRLLDKIRLAPTA